MNFKQAAIKALVGLILFPVIGALLVLVIKSGDVGQTVAIVRSNVSLQVMFMAAAGLIAGVVIQQSKAGIVELAIVGVLCAFVAIVVFGTYTGTDNFQPSYAASAFLGAPVSVICSALTLIPRMLFNIVRR